MTLGPEARAFGPFVILLGVDEKAAGREAVSLARRTLPEARVRSPRNNDQRECIP